MVAPLCIVQARLASTRLPQKMLLTIGGETLIARGHRIAVETFGAEHVVVAIPMRDASGPLGDELRRLGAQVFAWDGNEVDVLGRFWHCAHTYRWTPDAVIVRYTPDDPFKSSDAMRRVLQGERLPVEIGAEAFTLDMLDAAHRRLALTYPDIAPSTREHITYALFPGSPPPLAPEGQVWTIDTEDDYLMACEQIERRATKAWPNTGHTGDLSDPQAGELHDVAPSRQRRKRS